MLDRVNTPLRRFVRALTETQYKYGMCGVRATRAGWRTAGTG